MTKRAHAFNVKFPGEPRGSQGTIPGRPSVPKLLLDRTVAQSTGSIEGRPSAASAITTRVTSCW